MLDFKLSTDRNKGFLEMKEAEANEPQKSIIGVLRAVALKWKCKQIDFLVGNCRSAESNFYTKLKKLDMMMMMAFITCNSS